MEQLEAHQSKTFLVKVNKHIKHLDPDRYIQEATISHRKGVSRVYISCSAVGRSIRLKNVDVLACGVIYFPKGHFNV